MGSTNRLKDGLAILRAIAQSDAVRDVRERLREGAMALAESERLPRMLSASAGIVAALLDEPAEVYGRPETPVEGVDSWSVGDGEVRETELREAVDAELDPESYDEFEPEEAASLRDLEDADGVEEQLLGATEPEHDDEDDVEDRLLRFDTADPESGVGSAEGVASTQPEPPKVAPSRKREKAATRSPASKPAKAKKPSAKPAKAKKAAPAKPARTSSKPARPSKGPKAAASAGAAPSTRPPARRAPRKK